jgi:hypothetical protein
MRKILIVLILIAILTALSTSGWAVLCVALGLAFLMAADIVTTTAAVKRRWQ